MQWYMTVQENRPRRDFEIVHAESCDRAAEVYQALCESYTPGGGDILVWRFSQKLSDDPLAVVKEGAQ